MENIKDKHNIIIKYRNLLLESKGITPSIYYSLLKYFNAIYFIRNNILYYKNNKSVDVYQRVDLQEFSEAIQYMFGLEYNVIGTYLSQLQEDLNLEDYVKNDIEKNWEIITLPPTDKILDDLPF